MEADEEDAPHVPDDGRRTLRNLPLNLLRGAGGVFARESLRPFLVGEAATGAGSLLDDEVRDAIADEDDELAEFADDYLGPAGLGVVTLGLFVGGRYAESPRFRAMSYDLGVAPHRLSGLVGIRDGEVGIGLPLPLPVSNPPSVVENARSRGWSLPLLRWDF